MGRRRKHKKIPKEVVANKYDTNTIIEKQQLSSLCTASSAIEQEQQLSSIQSSWLPFKWVSRYDDNDVGIRKDNTNTSSHDVDGDSVSKADNTDMSSTNQPSHNSLLSELNDIKQQLTPAAKSCADAINDNNSYSTHTTTPEYEFRQARSICNPYESLGLTYSKNHSKKKKNRKRKYNNIQQSSSGFSQFINRSAIKLANIDALLGFILTSSPSLHNEEKQQQQRDEQPDNFVFVDLCGAPGGFSEYILYRHVHPATHEEDIDHKHTANSIIPCYGFGMSLIGSNADGKGANWSLEHLKRYHLGSNKASGTKNSSGSSHQKLYYQVCNGADGTGSIYNWDNVLQLQKEITTTLSTDKEDINNNKPLANLVVADGGFDSQRNCNNQESIAHKIIVSQTAAALTLLAPRGTLVLKMFGFKDERTRRMLHYLHGCFDQLTFVKPVLSRPASAERYLVCRGYTGQSTEWNGLKWRDEMIAGVATGREAVDDKDIHRLEELMNKFDTEMIQLNINTCQSIVNYLHEKRDAVTNDDSSTYANQEHSLNLKAYEEAWQLFS